MPKFSQVLGYIYFNTYIKTIMQGHSMLRQDKRRSCDNKGHNEMTCDIILKNLIMYTEKKNSGLNNI